MLVAMKPLMGRKCFPTPLPDVDRITRMTILSQNRDLKRVAQVQEEKIEITNEITKGPERTRTQKLERGMGLKMEPRGPRM